MRPKYLIIVKAITEQDLTAAYPVHPCSGLRHDRDAAVSDLRAGELHSGYTIKPAKHYQPKKA